LVFNLESGIWNLESGIKIMASKSRADIRRGVHSRIRKKVQGTQERPRLAVYRSLNHIYAQVIDDASGKTLAAASTTEKDLRGATGGNIEAAQNIGRTIAERAIAAGIANVVYDRGGYVYHGRVKALLDATREAGLNKNETAQEESKESNDE
jgi:large subunit ribosomal protein L18